MCWNYLQLMYRQPPSISSDQSRSQYNKNVAESRLPFLIDQSLKNWRTVVPELKFPDLKSHWGGFNRNFASHSSVRTSAQNRTRKIHKADWIEISRHIFYDVSKFFWNLKLIEGEFNFWLTSGGQISLMFVLKMSCIQVHIYMFYIYTSYAQFKAVSCKCTDRVF